VAKTQAQRVVKPRRSEKANDGFEALRDRLEAKQQDIMAMYKRDLKVGQETSDDGTEDIVDRANNAYHRELMFSLSDGERQLLLQVQEALKRFDSGSFGACLMADPELVADCLRAMIEAVPTEVPVTVKCRIGIDTQDDYGFFERFVAVTAGSGVRVFIVHARKAFLSGLSPRENREVPPLRYEVPQRLKRERPDLTVVLNGGLRSVAQACEWLPHFDGIMFGRQVCEDPWLLVHLDAPTETLSAWYLKRFQELRTLAKQDPSAFLHPYKDLEPDVLDGMAMVAQASRLVRATPAFQRAVWVLTSGVNTASEPLGWN